MGHSELTFRHGRVLVRPLVPDGPFDGFLIFPFGPQAYLEAFSLSGGHGLQ